MIKQTNYSKATMRGLLNVLPSGTMKDIANKLNIPYSTVCNCAYGKQYNEAIVKEFVKRYNAVKKELAK